MGKITSPARPGAGKWYFPLLYKTIEISVCVYMENTTSLHTTGIVKFRLSGGEVSPRWSEVFPYKRKTTGEVE